MYTLVLSNTKAFVNYNLDYYILQCAIIACKKSKCKKQQCKICSNKHWYIDERAYRLNKAMLATHKQIVNLKFALN